MSAPLPSHAAAPSWRARVLWLLLFIIVAAFGAVLLLRQTSLRPELTFPNGAVLTFEAITETDSAKGGHAAPDAGKQSWWGRTYCKVWMASPDWAQRWFPKPSLESFWLDSDTLIHGWRRVPQYRLWFNSAGPKVELGKWLVSIEGKPTEGHGYGNSAVLSTKSRAGITITSPPADRWFSVNTDTLPDKPTVHVTFKDREELLTIEVPNPKYRPETK
jgi:hypothetical protein